MAKRRYAILGAGALGGLYGGLLAKAGFEVHFLFHRDYDHVVANGLRVDTVLGDFVLPDVHAHATADSMPPCDVTIVGLKTTRNDRLPELLPPPSRDGGVVLVLQNGLDVEADSARVVGVDRVLGGCCFLCSNKVGPGHIRHIDYGRIRFGEYSAERPGVTPRAEQIRDDLKSAGIDAEAVPNLRLTRWQKLMWNIPFNGLSVALDASTKELMEQPDALALCEAIVREVHDGAASCGVEIPSKAIETTIEHTRVMVPYDSSMRLDFRNRRPMEIDAIFGRPLEAVARHGATMPRVEMLCQQLRFIDARNRDAATGSLEASPTAG